MTPKKLYDKGTVISWLDAMVDPMQSLIRCSPPAALIGIQRGGVTIGRYLQSQLLSRQIALDSGFGELNISFYRDDFSTVGLHPQVGPSQVPFDVEGKHIVLIDDVLGTGRTVRAAMNEIFDYGRPARISLAVLVQRAGHELPIRADVVGVSMDVLPGEYIDLNAQSMQVQVGVKNGIE